MKLFFKNIFLYTLLIGIIAGLNIQLGLRKGIRAIPHNTTAIIAGDSHGTGLRFTNSFNTCQPADPLGIQVFIAHHIIKSRNIKQIYLVVGAQSFSSEPERYMNNKEWVSSHSSRLAVSLWTSPEMLSLVTFTTALGALEGLLDLRREPNLFQGDTTDYGQESNLLVQRTHKRLQLHDVVREDWDSGIKRGFQALEKLHASCTEHKVKLNIICTPIHNSYRQKVHHRTWSNCISRLQQFAQNKQNCAFTDFSETSISDSLFYDCDHLNQSGFEYFNREYFQPLANNNALQQP